MRLHAINRHAGDGHRGSYFLDQQVTVRGKIAVLLFRNPHSYLELDAPDGTGRMQRWPIEMGAMLPLSKIRVGNETRGSAEGMGQRLR